MRLQKIREKVTCQGFTRWAFLLKKANFFKNTILQSGLLVKEFCYIPTPHILCWYIESDTTSRFSLAKPFQLFGLVPLKRPPPQQGIDWRISCVAKQAASRCKYTLLVIRPPRICKIAAFPTPPQHSPSPNLPPPESESPAFRDIYYTSRGPGIASRGLIL